MKEIVSHVLGTTKLNNFLTVAHSRVQSLQGHDDSGCGVEDTDFEGAYTGIWIPALIFFTYELGIHVAPLSYYVHICKSKHRSIFVMFYK